MEVVDILNQCLGGGGGNELDIGVNKLRLKPNKIVVLLGDPD